MSKTPELSEYEDWLPVVDVAHIEIDDGAPVDNIYAEKQMRLLTEPLYTSWGGPPAPAESGERRPFLAMANVGVFSLLHGPAVVPDVLLAVDVVLQPDFSKVKQHNTWFNWEMGKPPDVVIEVVSNRKGGELQRRKAAYETMRTPYYVVWDPELLLGGPALRAFRLEGGAYVDLVAATFPEYALALVPWDGEFEGSVCRWLRWANPDAGLVPTGAEAVRAEKQRAEAESRRAEAESRRAEAESRRAEAESRRAEAERKRADALDARIRELEARLSGDRPWEVDR